MIHAPTAPEVLAAHGISPGEGPARALPAAPARRENVRTLAEILNDPSATAEPVAVLPRIAWRERVTLLAAREKAGKSTLASAAVSAATQEEPSAFFGLFLPSAARIIWLALEEHPSDIARRFVRFEAGPENVVFVDRLTSRDPAGELKAIIGEERADCLVVDTLPAYTDHTGLVQDASSSTQWTPVMASFTRIARETKAAVVLLHHATKSGGYRDSTAIAAGVDMVIEMTEDAEDGSLRRFKCRGRWPASDFSARLEGNAYGLATGGDVQAASLEQRVLGFVTANPGKSTRTVQRGVGGKTATTNEAIHKLAAEGKIQDRGAGASGAEWYVVAACFPEEEGTAPGITPGGTAGSRVSLGESPSETVGNHLRESLADGGRFPVPAPRHTDGESPDDERPDALRLIYESPRGPRPGEVEI